MFQSQLREAINDTLLRKAEAEAFDVLAAQHGYPRPHYIERWAWRRAVLVAAFGRTIRFPTLHAFLEGALAQYATRFTATIAAANPQRVTAPADTFAAKHAGRLMRIPGVGLFKIASYTSSSQVELLPFATAYWDRADWSGIGTTLVIEDAEILAFEVHEPTPAAEEAGVVSPNGIQPAEPALVRVMMHGDVISATPPTYMQDADATRPVGQPKGGAVQEDAAEAGSQVSGPWPLYLVGTSVLREVAAVASRMLVPPGFRVEFRRARTG